MSSSKFQFSLIALILLAFIIRIETLDLSPLWFDETMEYWVATAPLDELFPAVKNALQDPPLYSLLLHYWMNFGREEFTLRLLSTFISLLSIATAFALGRHIHSPLAGIIAALLLAIWPPDIRFAQEVGQYAILIFSLLINLLILSRVRRTNHWKYWLGWTITGLLSIYNYYGSLLIIGAVTGSLFCENLFRRKKDHLARQLVASGLLSILALPLLVAWLPAQLFRGPTSNAFNLSFNPLPAEAVTFFNRTSALLGYQLTGLISDPALRANLRLAAVILLLLALLSTLYSLRKSKRHAYLLVWLVVSWVVYYAAGRLGVYPYGGSRHAIILTPLLLLSVSIGMATLWKIRPLLPFVLFVGIASVTALSTREPPQDLRTVMAYYLAARQETTPTYVIYGAVPGFRYQMQLKTGTVDTLPADWFIDCWAGSVKSYCAEDNIFYGRWTRGLPANEKFNQINSTVNTASETGFWIIFSNTVGDEEAQLLNKFNETHVIIDAIEARGASGYLLRKQ